MEWLITWVAQKNRMVGPTMWDHQIRNIEEYETIVPTVMESIEPGMMIDPDIVNFIQSRLLPAYKKWIPEKWEDWLYDIYFAENAFLLIENIVTWNSKEPLEDKIKPEYQLLLLQKPTELHNALQHNLEILDPSRATPSRQLAGEFLFDPEWMRENLSTVNQEVSIGELMSALEVYPIPYLYEYLNKLVKTDADQEKFCRLLKTVFYHSKIVYNYYSLIRFLRDSVLIRVRECAQDFIRRLDPLAAQILVGAKECWWDGEADALNICGNCQFPWWQFLPQWRCLAYCSRSNGEQDPIQCGRFAEPDQDYCRYHSENKPERRLKRSCAPSCATRDAPPFEYKSNPTKQAALRYQSTNRPVNAMTQIFSQAKKTEAAPIGFYLPVVRYSSLYYSNAEQEEKTKKGSTSQYCGKFFFYEPTSEYHLYLGKTCFFATKAQAFMKLQYLTFRPFPNSSSWLDTITDMWNGEKASTLLAGGKYSNYPFKKKDNQFFNYNIKQFLKQVKLSDRGMEFDNWLVFYFCTLFFSIADSIDCKYDQGVPVFYPTTKPLDLSTSFRENSPALNVTNPMGTFDFLDQPICILAKELGYDTVIFQHEIGGHDSCTEIMHTGNYTESGWKFSQIENMLPNRPGVIFPKIWFPASNGIVQVYPDGSVLLEPMEEQDLGKLTNLYETHEIEHEKGVGFNSAYLDRILAEEYIPAPNAARFLI